MAQDQGTPTIPGAQPPDQINAADLTTGADKPGMGIRYDQEEEVPFTLAGLQNFLGPRFHVKKSRWGNFQINLSNIRAYSDDDQLTAFHEARSALRAHGFQVTFKQTFRSNITGRFENWPNLWVQGLDDSRLNPAMRAKAALQRIVAIAEQSGAVIPLELKNQLGGGDEFPQAREVEPTGEDFDRLAAVQAHKRQVAEGVGVRRNQNVIERGPTIGRNSPGVVEDYSEIEPDRAPMNRPQPPEEEPE